MGVMEREMEMGGLRCWSGGTVSGLSIAMEIAHGIRKHCWRSMWNKM